jgi:hypothetical protein
MLQGSNETSRSHSRFRAAQDYAALSCSESAVDKAMRRLALRRCASKQRASATPTLRLHQTKRAICSGLKAMHVRGLPGRVHALKQQAS